jgi:hypothetical protein
MRQAGHVARVGERRNACKILAGKPERKRPLGDARRCRRRWEDNIRLNLKEYGGRCRLNACRSGLGPVAGSCGHCNETSCSIKGGEFLD